MDPEVQKIVDAAVAKAVAETRDQMRDLFEGATAGLRKNSDRLLRQKKAAESGKPKTAVEKYDEWEAGYNARQAAAKPTQRQHVRHTSSDIADGKVVIKKGVSTTEYQRLKKLAADTKAEIVYVADDDPAFAQQRRTGVILAHDFKFEGTRFVSADRLRELGGPIKARREIGEYVTFKSLSDLPEGARAAHDAAEVGDD